MKTFPALLACALAFASIGAHADRPAVSMPAELGAAYGRLGRAIMSRDEEAVKLVWAPDLVVNAPNNAILRRDEVIAALRSELLEYKDFKRVVEYVGLHENAAVVMGFDSMTPVKGPGEGQQVTRRFTDFWMKGPSG